MEMTDSSRNPAPTKKDAVSRVNVFPEIVAALPGAIACLYEGARDLFPSVPFLSHIRPAFLDDVMLTSMGTAMSLMVMGACVGGRYYLLTPDEKASVDAMRITKSPPAGPDRDQKIVQRRERT